MHRLLGMSTLVEGSENLPNDVSVVVAYSRDDCVPLAHSSNPLERLVIALTLRIGHARRWDVHSASPDAAEESRRRRVHNGPRLVDVRRHPGHFVAVRGKFAVAGMRIRSFELPTLENLQSP